MALANYGQLKTEIAEWLERDDLTAKIPTFIRLAETMINRDLRCRYNEKRIYVSGGITTEYFDLPSNFIEFRNFDVELRTDIDDESTKYGLVSMEYLPPEQMSQMYASFWEGIPQHYTIHGTELQVAPVPDQAYTINATYYYRQTPFSADADTNNVLTYYPGLYLYGALTVATTFQEDDDRTGLWAELYNSEVQTANQAERLGRYSGSTIQARPDFEE